MRETFSSLILQTQDLVRSDVTTSQTNLSTPLAFIKREINNSVRFIHAYLRNFKIQEPPKTAATVEDQQYYHYPPGVYYVTNATLTIGSVAYPLQIIDSEHSWNVLNQTTFSGTVIPQFIFPRRDDFGLWPTPAEADNTISFSSIGIPKDMTIEDYNTGTVTLVQNSATVTGDTTAFTAAMVGRWFKAIVDQEWYRISAYTSNTVITLESVFEGSSIAGDDYLIGESPEVPEELHELIPHRTAAMYMAGFRQDRKAAQKELNYFWTGDYDNTNRVHRLVDGGIIGFKKRYMARGRGNSVLVNRGVDAGNRYDERWTATLS